MTGVLTCATPLNAETNPDPSITQQNNKEKIMAPVQILIPSGNHFHLNEEGLRSILGGENVQNKKVVIVSVAGAFRKGKSFLLNFFLEYLYALQKSQKNGTPLEWLGEETRVQGFHWKSGARRDTVGMWMWGEPILIESKGKQVAVVLLDTQGAFDNQSTFKQCTTIFALSTLISSVQIYNVVDAIQEDALQNLSLFVEYGKIAMQHTQKFGKPFQSLCFCVRDFKCPDEFPYGKEGGSRYMQDVLSTPPGQSEELRVPRGQLSTCFEHLRCFLLPHPGPRVAERSSFNGAVKDIRPEFREAVREMAESLLSPDALQPKTINGRAVTCERIIQCFKEYAATFESSSKLQPSNILEANARLLVYDALDQAKQMYCRKMDKATKGRSALSQRKLEKAHIRSKTAALEVFDKQPLIASDSEREKYHTTLKELFDVEFERYMGMNSDKKEFGRGSPILLGVGLGVGASSAVAGTALAVAAGVGSAGVIAVPIAVAALTGVWGYFFTKPQIGRRFASRSNPLLASFRKNENRD